MDVATQSKDSKGCNGFITFVAQVHCLVHTPAFIKLMKKASSIEPPLPTFDTSFGLLHKPARAFPSEPKPPTIDATTAGTSSAEALINLNKAKLLHIFCDLLAICTRNTSPERRQIIMDGLLDLPPSAGVENAILVLLHFIQIFMANADSAILNLEFAQYVFARVGQRPSIPEDPGQQTLLASSLDTRWAGSPEGDVYGWRGFGVRKKLNHGGAINLVAQNTVNHGVLEMVGATLEHIKELARIHEERRTGSASGAGELLIASAVEGSTYGDML